MLATACSSILGETPVDRSDSTIPGSTEGTDTTASTGRDCVRFTGDHSAHINTGALSSDALVLAGETFICASDVVIVGEGNLNEIAAASQLAAALSGPLLFPEPRLASELGRLKPDRVHVVGSVDVNVPGRADTVAHDIASAVTLAADRLGVAEEVPTPLTPDASTVVETVLAIESSERVTSPAATASSSSTTAQDAQISVADIVTGLA
ncbi:MAG TPA: hypothetical protein VF115_04200, partial [Acidimicrobiia bacterium]